MEALAFVPLADMVEVEDKEGCVKGLEARDGLEAV
jgi:hypothetical protein